MAKKLDTGKPRMDLVNPRFLEELGEGLGFGASKYSDYNYKEGDGLDRSRLYASAIRHLLNYAKGEKIDEESGISHLTAVAINCMMLYTLEEEGLGKEYSAWKKDGNDSEKATEERREGRSNPETKEQD
jgi:hypothetical protein